MKNQENEVENTSQEQVNEVATTSENNEVSMFDQGTLMIPNTEAFGLLKSASSGAELAVQYRKQEDWYEFKDKPIRAFFLGFKNIPNKDGELIKCASFAEQDETTSQVKTWLAAQMVLVDSLQYVKPGTPVEIVFQGKKSNKSSDGSTNLFSVKALVLDVESLNQKGGK